MTTAPQAFIDAYVACALWSSFDETDGYGYHPEDIAPATMAKLVANCEAFYAANDATLNHEDSLGDSQAGHDFWLNHNGHGAGFWDGDWPEPLGDILDKAARAFSEVSLYVGDDGLIYA